jgi:ribosomal-protein-alanine N-acetyltransferase
MSAQWRSDDEAASSIALHPMTTTHLDAVMAIESAAYSFPWTRGNFIDSLAAGYSARVLASARGEVLAYFIAMPGVDEMHLLNITVAPAAQGRGHARMLLAALIDLCHREGARELWLEVRASNTHARSIYERMGFVAAGQRKGYYPAPFGRREDAIVMRLRLDPPAGADDALE